MKIAVLLPQKQNSSSEISYLEPDVNPKPYLEEHYVDILQLKKNENYKLLEQKLQGFDCYLNLCDGSADDDRAGIEVVRILELQRLPFTGANSMFYDPTRDEMKHAATICGVNVPYGYYVNKLNSLDLNSIYFPCIVKHPQSYSSIGLTKNSVVADEKSLQEQIESFISKFGGALVEEFIEGREFTVLVVSTDKENVVAFDAAEIIFPEGETFKHFELKWQHHQSMKYVKAEPENLNNYLKTISINIYRKMNGNGYARFDYRMNAQGEIYFLELNPNCSVYYPDDNSSSADEILKLHDNGHELFTKYILNFAMQRFE